MISDYLLGYRMATEFLEGMELCRIAFVRRAIRSCKERNLLGCLGGSAFEGGRDFVKSNIGQVLAAGVLQGNRLPSTINLPTVQSRKHTSVRLSVSPWPPESTYSKRVQATPSSGRKELMLLPKPSGRLLQALVWTETCLQFPLNPPSTQK